MRLGEPGLLARIRPLLIPSPTGHLERQRAEALDLGHGFLTVAGWTPIDLERSA